MRLGLVASLLCLCTVSLCLADPAKAAIRKDLNVPPESLSPALQQVATTYELQVLYPTQVAKDLKTHGAVGFFTPDDALKAVLSGTGLTYKYLDAQTVTIVPAALTATATGGDQSQTSTQDTTKEAGKKSSQDFRVAQVDQGQTASPSTVEEQASKKKRDQLLQEVVVTGSRLQLKSGEGPQQVKVYTAQDIDQSGQTTVSNFLNTLPSVSVSIGDSGLQLATGTTVQLHGLPVGGTLILINGRRAETSGSPSGNFFNLDNIPLSAVERIEIVSGASSAVYGSDALAGVVNIILKDRFNGFEASARYGWASGTDDYNGSVAWGESLEKGGVSLVAGFQSRSELDGFARSITANEDFTRFGGPDSRFPFCNPGNVMTIDGSALPGAPPGSNDSFAAVSPSATGNPRQTGFMGTYGATNKCSPTAYIAQIPALNRFGLLGSGHYDVTSSVQFFTEVLYSREHVDAVTLPPIVAFSTVAASNSYNPFGETVAVNYLLTTLGGQGTPYDAVFIRPLIGARGNLADQWHWEVTAWDSEDRTDLTNTNQLNYAALQNALDSPNPASALNPFVAGAPGSPQLLKSLVYDQFYRYRGKKLATNGFVRGPLVQLPAGALEVVVGAEYSRDKYFSDNLASIGNPSDIQATDFRRSSAIFAEARIPILANHTDPKAGDRLALTVSGRYDDYSDFGGKGTPQIGVQWRPVDTLLMRGAYGRAFVAPPLQDLYSPPLIYQAQIADPKRGNSTTIATVNQTGNLNLGPQTGESRTVGFDYSSRVVSNLQISAQFWSIDEANTIQFLPSPQTFVDDEDLFPGHVIRGPGLNGQPGPIIAINDTPVNFGTINVKGLDYQLTYKWSTKLGTFNTALSATNTLHYSAAVVPGGPSTNRVSQANDDGNWAPRWKGTAVVGWTEGPYTLSFDGRYVGRYQDYDSTNKIGSFWLCDANVRYAVGRAAATDNHWLQGTYVELGGVNVFNVLPQFSNYLSGLVGFDPTQADIRGRFLYAQLGVKW